MHKYVKYLTLWLKIDKVYHNLFYFKFKNYIE